MKIKKIILTLLIFSILLSISSVSAVESNFTDLYSDTNPITTLDSLNAEIDNSNENGIIYLNETELHAKNTIEPITIDKSISIIGENTIINGDEKGAPGCGSVRCRSGRRLRAWGICKSGLYFT